MYVYIFVFTFYLDLDFKGAILVKLLSLVVKVVAVAVVVVVFSWVELLLWPINYYVIITTSILIIHIIKDRKSTETVDLFESLLLMSVPHNTLRSLKESVPGRLKLDQMWKLENIRKVAMMFLATDGSHQALCAFL